MREENAFLFFNFVSFFQKVFVLTYNLHKEFYQGFYVCWFFQHLELTGNNFFLVTKPVDLGHTGYINSYQYS